MTDVLTFGVGPLVPRWVKRITRPMVRRLRRDISLPGWIAPAFAEHTALDERITPPRPGARREGLFGVGRRDRAVIRLGCPHDRDG